MFTRTITYLTSKQRVVCVGRVDNINCCKSISLVGEKLREKCVQQEINVFVRVAYIHWWTIKR